MIRYTCSACGKDHMIGNEFGGRQAKCPACGAPLRIPEKPAEAMSDKALDALIGKVATLSPTRAPVLEDSAGSGLAIIWKVLAGMTLAFSLAGAVLNWDPFPRGIIILLSGIVTAVLFHTIGVAIDLLRRIEKNTRKEGEEEE